MSCHERFTLPSTVVGFAIATCQALIALQGPARQTFPQPEAARQATVTAIPGVVAAGTQWKLAWQGTDNADGLVGTPDGGLLFAQEQPNRISKLDASDKVSVYLQNTHGAGALAIDAAGRLLAVARTCTDPGGRPGACSEPTHIAVLAPERKVVADNIGGRSLGRLNDLVADKKGGVYFNGDGTFYVSRDGRVTSVGVDIRTNGLMLSTDERTLYVTNGGVIVAFDVLGDGTVTNQRNFGKLSAGGAGDGMAVDEAGRLYVTSRPGVQVLGPDGAYLGLIPTPRAAISVAFAGPDKKTLYIVGSGALGSEGQEFKTP